MLFSQAESTIISNTAALDKFLKLDQKGQVIAEYVWIDSSSGVRSKCKVCWNTPPKSLKKVGSKY